jgi:protein-tyrosine-phosphatase
MGERPWRLSSAGFFADHPLPPVPEVEALLQARGYDTSQLTSKRIEKPLVRQATSIFAMTEMHLTTLCRQFPKVRERAHLVTEFSSLPEYRDRDVPDPIGREIEVFEETFRILDDAIPRIIQHVDEL